MKRIREGEQSWKVTCFDIKQDWADRKRILVSNYLKGNLIDVGLEIIRKRFLTLKGNYGIRKKAYLLYRLC